jgi:glycosyltransferase involved in cell wall biosynthesis
MRRLGPGSLRRLICQADCDVLYLNSFFHPRVCAMPLALRRIGVIPHLPVIIAPRGGFSRGAMNIRGWKKTPYLLASRMLCAERNILWHATSDLEADDIGRCIGPGARIAIAPNVRSCEEISVERAEPKRPGVLRLVFLSRITPKKNLLGAIRALRFIAGRISLDIYGPIGDLQYWHACEMEARRLPQNVRIDYRGTVAPADVMATLAQYDAMFLPTLGENFGHAIVESLAAGCPVIISDRTPWRNLVSSGVGWDVPLESAAGFERVLAELAAMDEPAHRAMRGSAQAYARRFLANDHAVEQTRRLFQEAFAVGGGATNTYSRHAA